MLPVVACRRLRARRTEIHHRRPYIKFVNGGIPLHSRMEHTSYKNLAMAIIVGTGKEKRHEQRDSRDRLNAAIIRRRIK
jgi:hypothetical protein